MNSCFKKIIARTIPIAVLALVCINGIHIKKAQAETNTWDFDFTGQQQIFTSPYSGKYKLEVWGGQGGSGGSYSGGCGGYSSGEVDLTVGQVIYIYVGGQGKTNIGWNLPVNVSYGGWNGGGGASSTGTNTSGTQASGGGGGATDIRLGGTELNNRVIVAGGGGGIGLWASGTNTAYANGGYGGGLSGGSQPYASGATQTSGYALGQGANPVTHVDLGGGGGGYYGGYASASGANDSYICGGGGGSGYIGGVQNGQTIAGNTSMPSPSGSTEVGHSGNGHARITMISSSAPKVVLNIEPEKSNINLNETVSANLIIDNVTEIAAEDVKIKYDNTKLQFLGYEQVDGIMLAKTSSANNELRFVLASKGVANVVNSKKSLLKLNFKGIAAGDASIDVTSGMISDGISMKKTLADEECGQANIKITDIG